MSTEKLQQIMENLERLAFTLSVTAGASQAQEAVLMGILSAIRNVPGVAAAVQQSLEKAYASNLATLTNEIASAEFDRSAAEFVRALEGESAYSPPPPTT